MLCKVKEDVRGEEPRDSHPIPILEFVYKAF